jgi:ribosomal protein L1
VLTYTVRIAAIVEGSKTKQRKFTETIELQIGLKNYDPQKDKRFSGTVKLPYIPRPNMKICILGDVKHCEQATALAIDNRSVEDLKKLNKNKKLVKKLGEQLEPHQCRSKLRFVQSTTTMQAAWEPALLYCRHILVA